LGSKILKSGGKGMEKFSAGVDVGYGQVKAIVGDSLNSRHKILFPSAIERRDMGEVVLEELANEKRKEENLTSRYWLRIDNEDVRIGENATGYEAGMDRSLLNRDPENYRILALGPVAMYLADNDISEAVISLGVGVPQKTPEDLIDRLVKRLIDVHDLAVGNYEKGKKVYRNVKLVVSKTIVREQGLGAFISLALQYDDDGNILTVDNSAFDGYAMVVDFGTFTTNVVLFENGKFDRTRSDGKVEYGTIDMINELETILKTKYGIMFSPHAINRELIIKGINVVDKMDGTSIDISEIKREVMERLWNKIARYIDDSIGSAFMLASQSGKSLKVFFTGGGAKLFADKLKEKYSNSKYVVFSRDPIFDNALGFYVKAYFESKKL
jgi:hypothetical protein